jgi:hypothetical protein
MQILVYFGSRDAGGGCDGSAGLVEVKEPSTEPAPLVEVAIGELEPDRILDATHLVGSLYSAYISRIPKFEEALGWLLDAF